MKAVAALGLGGLVALALACSAGKQPMATAPMATAGETAPAESGGPRAQLDALDAAITADFERLGIARPAATSPVAACTPGVDCTAAMRQGTEAPTADATCKPGASDTCKDTCTLGASICSNAEKICTIAGDLGGADAYANDKCASAKTSCETASERCCGCV